MEVRPRCSPSPRKEQGGVGSGSYMREPPAEEPPDPEPVVCYRESAYRQAWRRHYAGNVDGVQTSFVRGSGWVPRRGDSHS